MGVWQTLGIWVVGGIGLLMFAPIFSYLITRAASAGYFRSKREYEQVSKTGKHQLGAHSR